MVNLINEMVSVYETDGFSRMDALARFANNSGESPEFLSDPEDPGIAFDFAADQFNDDMIRIGLSAISQLAHVELVPSGVARAMRDIALEYVCDQDHNRGFVRGCYIAVSDGDLIVWLQPGADALARHDSDVDEWVYETIRDAVSRAIAAYDDGYHVPLPISALMLDE